jgi:hypothetical protein
VAFRRLARRPERHRGRFREVARFTHDKLRNTTLVRPSVALASDKHLKKRMAKAGRPEKPPFLRNASAVPSNVARGEFRTRQPHPGKIAWRATDQYNDSWDTTRFRWGRPTRAADSRLDTSDEVAKAGNSRLRDLKLAGVRHILSLRCSRRPHICQGAPRRSTRC